MELTSADRRTLWRYHLRAAASSGAWMIVTPVLVTLAVLIWLPLGSAEGMETIPEFTEVAAPLLAAVLVAVALWNDFRSGTLRLLAGQPPEVVRRSLFGRFAAAVSLALLTAAVGVLLFGVFLLMGGGWPSLNLAAALGGIPSTLFLAAFALAAALLFRSPWAGIGAAFLYWLQDLRFGAGANPVLSLRAGLAGQPLTPEFLGWWLEKLFLLGAAVLLVWWAIRLAKEPLPYREAICTGLIAFAVLMLVYSIGGAAINVSYTYAHRDRYQSNLSTTLTRELDANSPLPVSFLFGSAFRAFIAVPEADAGHGGKLDARIEALQAILKRWPNSIWAEPALSELAAAHSLAKQDVEALSDWWKLADRYPYSSSTPKALETIVTKTVVEERIAADAPGAGAIEHVPVPFQVRFSAAKRLLERYPDSPGAAAAAGILEEYSSSLVRPGEMLKAALIAAKADNSGGRAHWHLVAAAASLQMGKLEDARKLATQARDEASAGPGTDHFGKGMHIRGAAAYDDRSQAEGLLRVPPIPADHAPGGDQ